MPAALALTIRQEIIERRTRGERFRHIAAALRLSYDTVRHVWRHWQQYGHLTPNYAACRHPGPRKPAPVHAAALALKQQHPRWGAVVIRLALLDDFPAADVPAERTLQTWFRQAGVNRSPAQHHPRPAVRRGSTVHQVWAVDAKEQITVVDGSGASWLTVSDEASGAILHSQVFPPEALVASAPGRGAAGVSNGV